MLSISFFLIVSNFLLFGTGPNSLFHLHVATIFLCVFIQHIKVVLDIIPMFPDQLKYVAASSSEQLTSAFTENFNGTNSNKFVFHENILCENGSTRCIDASQCKNNTMHKFGQRNFELTTSTSYTR